MNYFGFIKARALKRLNHWLPYEFDTRATKVQNLRIPQMNKGLSKSKFNSCYAKVNVLCKECV